MKNVPLNVRNRGLLIAVALVIMCSFFGTLAQFAFKKAALYANTNQEWYAIFMNPYIVAGYTLSGLNLFSLTIALKKADLSYLYPFIGLTYVWVTLFSPIIFPTETYATMRFFGIALIVLGVTFIGIGGKNED